MIPNEQDRIEAVMAQLGAPAVVLEAGASGNPLACCLGGIPPLPDGTEAPRHSETGRPLAFVGQINFADVPHTLAEEFALPLTGLLQLFHLWQDGWIEDHSEPNHVVLWHPSPDTISWRAAVEALTICPVRLPLTARRGHSWVSRDRVAAMNTVSDEALDAFYRHGRPFHQLGGAAKIVQFDPLEQLSRDLQPSLLDRLRHRPVSPNEPWRLLWQLDSDPRVNLDWMDGGVFQLLITQRDLAAGHIGQAVGYLQTY